MNPGVLRCILLGFLVQLASSQCMCFTVVISSSLVVPHQMECHVKRQGCFLQSQGHSKSSVRRLFFIFDASLFVMYQVGTCMLMRHFFFFFIFFFFFCVGGQLLYIKVCVRTRSDVSGRQVYDDAPLFLMYRVGTHMLMHLSLRCLR